MEQVHKKLDAILSALATLLERREGGPTNVFRGTFNAPFYVDGESVINEEDIDDDDEDYVPDEGDAEEEAESTETEEETKK